MKIKRNPSFLQEKENTSTGAGGLQPAEKNEPFSVPLLMFRVLLKYVRNIQTGFGSAVRLAFSALLVSFVCWSRKSCKATDFLVWHRSRLFWLICLEVPLYLSVAIGFIHKEERQKTINGSSVTCWLRLNAQLQADAVMALKGLTQY